MFILSVRKISILWHSKEISLSHPYFKQAVFQFKLNKALLIFLDFFKDNFIFIIVWSISSSLDFNFFINLMKISYALLLITLVLAQLTLALHLGATKDI